MLIKHPGVNMVSFTGGTDAGRAIASIAAEKLMPVLLELGGKSPHIVFEDADLDRAAREVAAGIFGSMGQNCVAGSRLFVHRSVRDKVVAKVAEIGRELRLGPPLDANSDLGPLASFSHRDRVHGLVERARAEGGSILVGGTPPSGERFARGAYYLPTVIDGLDNRSALCQSEIFGPVLCMLTFDDEANLIAQANDTVYGLACGIWTESFERAYRVAQAIDAGTIWINTYRQNSVATPFGGFKRSGLGRERGPQGLAQYQRIKSLFIGVRPSPLDGR
jgi:betaine-aldehyde dehydrogenase